MMRSMFTGVTGLRNHQTRMDVIANNVANVNTVAFKAGRVTFKEGFAQLLQGASRPPGDHGGVNPIQIGLGMQIGSMDQLFTQGNVETTGMNTDLAIQGDSFFTVRKGDAQYYTRSGNFQIDGEGHLVSPTNGFIVQGRIAVQGDLQEGITDIKLPFGQKAEARETTKMNLNGNLDSGIAVGGQTQSAVTVFDSLGKKHEVRLTYEKTAAGAWRVFGACDTATVGDGTGAAQPDPPNPIGVLNFNIDGTLNTTTSTLASVELLNPQGGAQNFDVTIDVGAGAVNGITQFAAASSAVLRDQDGYAMGTLENFTIDRSGKINGAFSNGNNIVLGQIVMADFNNPGGLQRIGDNMFTVTGNSGNPVLGWALEGSRSFVTSGALEMSNVDLANEFTSMIVTQRGFQANGRIITSSDEMLQEVVSLKR